MRAGTMQRMPHYAPLLTSFALHAALILPIAMTNDVLKSPFGSSSERKKVQVKSFHVGVKLDPVVRKRSVLTASTGRTNVTKKVHSDRVSRSIEAPLAHATSDEKPESTSMGVADGATATAKEHYIFGLRQLLEQKKVYPAMSRRMGEIGHVVVALQITRDGSIENVEIKSNSSFSRLDEAALATVSGIRRYQPIPEEIKGERISVLVPIEYSLQ